MPCRRSRASWMSASVGAVRCVAKVKNLLHYLAHCGERIELATLHLVEQPPQLWIVGHRPLEVGPRPPRRDRKHLIRQVLASPLLEPTLGLEIRTVLLDLGPQLGNVLAAGGVGHDDRRTPRAVAVERHDRAHLV